MPVLFISNARYNFMMGVLRARVLFFCLVVFFWDICLINAQALGGSPRKWHRDNRRIGIMYWGGWYPTGITSAYVPRIHYGTYNAVKLGINIGSAFRIQGGTGTTEIKEIGHPRMFGVQAMVPGWNFTPMLGLEWWQIKVPGSRGGDSFVSVGLGFEYTARWGWNLGMGGYYKTAAAGLFLQVGFFFCTAWASVKCKSSIFF